MNILDYLKQYYSDCLTIINTLQKHGYQTLIVGGAIRDFYLELKPKDIDIVTIATPIQIKRIFRNRALIIGKRFQIVHLRTNKNIYEITTFRRAPTKTEKINAYRKNHDNYWGNFKEDIYRRDFTVNCIYFDPIKNNFLDPFNGFKSLKNKKIVSIEKESISFKEDPVRMIRALKLYSQEGFSLSLKTKSFIKTYAPLLHKISQRRRLEELLKLTYKDYFHTFLKLCRKYKLIKPFLTKLESLPNKDFKITNNLIKNRFLALKEKTLSRNYTLCILAYRYIEIALNPNSKFAHGWDKRISLFEVKKKVLEFYYPYLMQKTRSFNISKILFLCNQFIHKKKFHSKVKTTKHFFYAKKIYILLLNINAKVEK